MIDFNAKIGHWPYRPVKGLDALLEAMDAHGVERAVVSSLNAVFYLNPQDGNDELAAAVGGHRDRLVPLAVLRPGFTGWEDDLAACLDEAGMAGVVLYPNYHRFDLGDPALGHLMATAAQRGIPVCVQAGLEDPRRQYGREKVFDVPGAAVGGFARAYPDVTVVGLGLKIMAVEEVAGEGDDAAPLPDNFYFDTSNYERMGELEHAVGRFGADKILLGTNFPLFNVLANFDKLAKAGIPDSAKRAIGGGNAAKILDGAG
ncbi:MAG: amidohydrolase family protein [Candidatus Hydrogenedentes bacterium]|nr:amidohydrolase family protein [Candidatus Hydrogenedentota bacterium]